MFASTQSESRWCLQACHVQNKIMQTIQAATWQHRSPPPVLGFAGWRRGSLHHAPHPRLFVFWPPVTRAALHPQNRISCLPGAHAPSWLPPRSHLVPPTSKPANDLREPFKRGRLFVSIVPGSWEAAPVDVLSPVSDCRPASSPLPSFI